MKKFVHLHTHSHYSLLDGLAKVDELINRAKDLKMDALAITDHGNLYGAIEFYKKAKKAGIKPILGVEAYVAPNGLKNKTPKIDEKRFHITLLAKNNIGWKNIIKLVTISNLDGFYYKPRIDKELLKELSEGIICLSGCFSSELSKLILFGKKEEAENLVKWYFSVFGEDFYIEIQKHNEKIFPEIINLSKKFSIPLVATQDVHYVLKEDKTAHEILLAVQTNSKLDDEDRLTLKNYDVSMSSYEEMEKYFESIPEALENTIKIAEKCDVSLELGKTKLPKFILPEEEKSSFEYLEKITRERIKSRYKSITPEIESRLEKELLVIEKTDFSDYFLIVQDFILWAKTHGIVVGPGRGSAAGSIVSYALGITNIDPIKYDLLFERFLNPDRIQVPDIDVDFTDIRRDEVLSYVKEKYGENHVAQIITFGTMMARAALRDTGRALGLPYMFCDVLAKLIPFNSSINQTLESVPEFKKEYNENLNAKKLIDASKKLEGTVRHASVHACGVVISPNDLTDTVPLQRAPQNESSVITQFEMYSIQDIGLLKMDFLGLKNLTIIEKTLKLIRDNIGETIEIDSIPLDDKKTFELLQKGDTTGVFQLESSGMRHYLKELIPTELEDIIAMISLYRPGPMDLIPHYIARKLKKEKITYIHPKLEPILGKTYGIGVYQEQMMRIAQDLAGFSLAEADTLRKAIGKKIKELLSEQKEKLLKGMKEKGIDEKSANAIWDLFPPFARYGFNRSHAACYAMISYQTAYLKAHYKVEFMASLLNISGTEIERINFLINEAKHLGISVLPPDINSSFQDFTVEEKNIRYGLLGIKNIGANIVNYIIEERARGGTYESLSNFLSRSNHRDLNKKSLESLIKCGALDSLGIKREESLSKIDELLKFNQVAKKNAGLNQVSLFGNSAELTSLKNKNSDLKENKNLILSWEKELLGLYLTDHPWNLCKSKVEKTTIPIKKLLLSENKNESERGPLIKTAGIVSIIQKIITKKGDPMLFVTIEDLTDSIELLVFNNTLEKTENLWKENTPVVVSGRLSFRNGDIKFICNDAREI